MAQLPDDLLRLRDMVRKVAKKELVPRFAQVAREFKADGSLITEADHAAQNRLEAELALAWPDLPLLGEETPPADQQRILQQHRAAFWCLDPLDGTSNFTAGVPLFAVSLARIGADGPELGIVYDPLRDECFAAVAGQGAWCNDQPLHVPELDIPLKRALAAVDMKRLDPGLASRLAARPPYGSQRNFGSTALEWCWLAAGRVHVYIHGGQKLWDYAAGLLILREAGGSAETLDGKPINCDSLVPCPVLAAGNATLLADFRTYLNAPRP
jgi:myo-inositol-1(or 4)-monophosphatase